MNNIELAKLSRKISTMNRFDIEKELKNLINIDRNIVNKIVLFCSEQYKISISDLPHDIVNKLDSMTLLLLSDNFSILEKYFYHQKVISESRFNLLVNVDDVKLISYVEYYKKPIIIDIENNYIDTRLSIEHIDKFYQLYLKNIIKFKHENNKNLSLDEFKEITTDCFSESPCFNYNRLVLTNEITEDIEEDIYYFIDSQVLFLYRYCQDIFNDLFPNHVKSYIDKKLIL